MQFTIIADDNQVYVEGHMLVVDLTGLDPNIHAVQWNGVTNTGWIECKHDPHTGARQLNEKITDPSPYQAFIDRWETAAKAQPAQPSK